MGQGFGNEPKQLGYVLLLLPEVNAYAASQSMPEIEEESFHGITNSLEMARRWRKKRAVEKAIFDYLGVFEDKVAEEGSHTVVIKRLQQLPNGELSTSDERSVEISRELVE